ncbi:MAG: transposase [Huintestinicola sp.]
MNMENKHYRKQNRLINFDYSSEGAYFITFCVKDKKCLLWNDHTVGAHSVRPETNQKLSHYGEAVKTGIENIMIYHPNVYVDKYVIMPNHIHMIIFLGEDDGISAVPSISLIVKQLKEYVTKTIGISIWQKSFHDHIIRNRNSYLQIAKYIDENPEKWTSDCFYIQQH